MERQLCLALACVVLLLASPAGGEDDASPGLREWNQVDGNCYRSRWVDAAPVKGDPRTAWRVELGDALFSEPVTWGGVVYVVGGCSYRRDLFAIAIESGEILASRHLSKGGEVSLCVWQGIVIVTEAGVSSGYVHKKGTFTSSFRDTDETLGPPLLYGGSFLTNPWSQVRVRHLGTRKTVDGPQCFRGALALCGDPPRQLVGSDTGTEYPEPGNYAKSRPVMILRRILVEGLGTSSPTFGESMMTSLPGLVYVVRLDGRSLPLVVLGSDTPDVVSLSRTGFAGAERRYPSAVFGPWGGKLVRLATQPAVVQGKAYGFDDDGALIELDGRAMSRTLLAPGRLPKGARQGEASAAGDVVFFGNWALEASSGRVLWCLPELAPTTPAVPAGDHRLVVGIEEGRLLCLTDLAAPAAAEGAPTAKDDLAETEESEVYRKLLGPVEADFLAGLDAIVLSFARAGMVSDCRRLLDLAREYGLDQERLRSWTEILTGAREKHLPAQRRAVLLAEEDALRTKMRDRLLAGADRSRRLGMGTAATVLFADAEALRPGEAGEFRARIEPLVPAAFPFSGDDRAESWAVWARSLLPAGGEFLPADDPAWKRFGAPWTEDTIALATRNIRLFSRDHDVRVVTGCLRNGEGAIRALKTFFGRSEESRLDVLLHRNPEEFRAEAQRFSTSPESLAGFYSPSEKVSRFFVPRDGETGDVLGRDLFSVMNHELTHHYLDVRWSGGGKAGGSCIWAVEGIARFIEDQTVELGRRAIRFDDDTVRSVDAASLLRDLGVALRLGDLLRASRTEFAALSAVPRHRITLRNTARTYLLSDLNVFYEEAGSLVFFLLNRAGPERREAFVDHLRRVYAGEAKTTAAADLGYPDLATLESDYATFLEEIRR